MKGNTAWVQPGGHRHSVPVPADRLKLFKKGNHDLGGECMSRHERIERIATLRTTLADRKNVRGFTVQEAHAWLGSGENPVVLCELEPRTYLPARLIALRGDQCVVAPIGTDIPPQQWPLIETFIENGIKTSQEDWNLLAKSIDDKIRARFTASVKKPEAPAPTPAVEAPKPVVPKPQPQETRLIVQEPSPPVDGELPDGDATGEFVLVCKDTHEFWRRESQGEGTWVTSLDEAKVYNRASDVRRAGGRMRTHALGGRQVEGVPMEKAKWLAQMWARGGNVAVPGSRPPKWINSHAVYRKARPSSELADIIASNLISTWAREGKLPANAFKRVTRAEAGALYNQAGSPYVRIFDDHFLEDCGFYRVHSEIDRLVASGERKPSSVLMPTWKPDGTMIPAQTRSDAVRAALAQYRRVDRPTEETPEPTAPVAKTVAIQPLRIVEPPKPAPERAVAKPATATVMTAKDKYRRALLDKAQAEALRLQAEAEMIMAKAEMEAEAL